MKPIRITADFSGYPDGKTERVFVAGQEPDDLDDEYADLLIRKGLAEETASAKLARAASPLPVPAPNPATTPAPAGEKKDDAK